MTYEEAARRLIVSLDVGPSKAASLATFLRINAGVSAFKLSASNLLVSAKSRALLNRLLTPSNPQLPDEPPIRTMLDLKLWDIPSSVERIAHTVFSHRFTWLTVRADSVAAAMKARDNFSYRDVVAVDGLTSGFYGGDSLHSALPICRAAVVSPVDVAFYRQYYPQARLFCPGIRPVDFTGSYIEADDHNRARGIGSPTEAIRNGADYLIVGRPITAAPDPVAAARLIIEEIARAA